MNDDDDNDDDDEDDEDHHFLFVHLSIFRISLSIIITAVLSIITLGHHSSEQPFFAKLGGSEVDVEWGSHETKVHMHLEERNKLIVLREMILSEAIPFHKFFDENCKFIGSTALICFYIGTALMLIATMIYMWALYVYTYRNSIGASIGLVTILLSLIITLTIAIYLRFHDPTIVDLSKPINDPDFEIETRTNRKRNSRLRRSKLNKMI